MSDFAKYANAVVQTKAVYMKDSDKYEEELNNPPAETVNKDTPPEVKDSSQPHDWEKRYKDLQSYADRKLNGVTAELEQLKQQLAQEQAARREAESKPKTYPATAEDLQAWSESFPDFNKILTTFLEMNNDKIYAKMKEEIKAVESVSKAIAAEKGWAELLRLHPDAKEIDDSPEFREWAEAQNPAIQNLFKSANPKDIATGLDIYKKFMNIPDKRAAQIEEAKKASEMVATNSKVETGNKPRTWRESEVAKMHPRLFAKHAEEIDKAISEGRFEFDLTNNN